MQMDYNPAGVKPMWTDEAGGILLGLDADNRPMGYMLEGVTGGSPVTVPLPEEFRIELADWNIVLGTGQSLILGTMEISAVYSTTQLYANRCFGSGVKSSKSGNTFGGTLVTPGTSTTKLLVEDALDPYDPPAVRGETVMSSVNHTSYLAARENGIAPSDLVFCASTTGHGGYSIDLLVHGAVWHQQLIDHITEWKARADEVPERTSALWWVDHLQGESDGSMSQLEWGTKTGGYFTDIEGHAASTYGQDFPPHFGIYQLARKGGPQLAIMDLVAARPNVHITTPIYHLPAADNIGHLTGLGYLRYGKYAGRTRKQVMIDKREPDCIWPVSVTAVGQKVTFRYRTPTRLILDTTLLFPTQDMGFAVQDTVGILTLTNIATGKWFAGHDGRGYCDVTMTVNRALVGAWEGRYARDYRGVGLIVDTAVSGNLRDTTMDTFFQGGTEYPLFHVAPSSVLAGVSI
jgi:hypothetical protein